MANVGLRSRPAPLLERSSTTRHRVANRAFQPADTPPPSSGFAVRTVRQSTFRARSRTDMIRRPWPTMPLGAFLLRKAHSCVGFPCVPCFYLVLPWECLCSPCRRWHAGSTSGSMAHRRPTSAFLPPSRMQRFAAVVRRRLLLPGLHFRWRLRLERFRGHVGRSPGAQRSVAAAFPNPQFCANFPKLHSFQRWGE
jgi:hypothetical protein